MDSRIKGNMSDSNIENIRKKIREFVISNFHLEDGSKLSNEISFLEEGIIDSIGVLELVSFLEETFEFRVEDEEIIPDNFDSVDKLVIFVNSKLP